jgi:bifunctional non-homologous end joining protein LigD
MADRNPLNRLPAEAKARLRKKSQPEWIAPMLATLTDERFSRQGWLFEPKWDGERCLAFRRDREMKLFSRNRIVLNEKYPEIMMALHQQETDSFIADGEIVTFKNGITSFAKLQERMQVGHPSADQLRRVPVWLYLFDLLYLDRYDTRQVPLRYRKELLRNTFDFKGSFAIHGPSRNRGRSVLSTGVPQGMGGGDRKEWRQCLRLQENAPLVEIQVR